MTAIVFIGREILQALCGVEADTLPLNYCQLHSFMLFSECRILSQCSVENLLTFSNSLNMYH